MGLLLITHDLAVVSGMAHRVALMYAGQIIEVAPADEFFAAPQAPVRARAAARVARRRPARRSRWRRSPAPCRRCRRASPAAASRRAARSAMAHCRSRRRRELIDSGALPPVRCLLYDARARRARRVDRRRRRRDARGRALPAGRGSAGGGRCWRCGSCSVAFPIRTGCCSAARATSTPSTACRFEIARGPARWRWSASRAAARRPPARPSCNCCAARRDIDGAALLEGRNLFELQGDELLRRAARHPDHLPGPVRVAQPAHARLRASSKKGWPRCSPTLDAAAAPRPHRAPVRAGRPAPRRAASAIRTSSPAASASASRSRARWRCSRS